MIDSPTSAVEIQRSTFVTVLAWIFIILAGFSTLISALQNVMLSYMIPMDQMNQVLSDPDAQEHIPIFARYVFSNFRVIFLGFFFMSAITLISAIGLLKRKNWARIIFVVIMSLGILWNVFGLFMQHSMFNSMPAEIQSELGDSPFGAMMTIMKVFSYIMAIGFCALFAWIIKKLVSVRIKAEFRKSTQTHIVGR